MSRPLPLSLEDRECWRVYESRARRAAIEYAAHPNVVTGVGTARRCIRHCGSRTYHQDGVCKRCRVSA